MTNILLTGGAGYIGVHACVELLQAGLNVIVYDNFSNSSREPLRRVELITGKKPTVIEGDMRDEERLLSVLAEHSCKGVVHFAGLKAVGDSNLEPLNYYDNNVVGTINLLRAMRRCGVRRLVFSSSATVYGEPQFLPLTELHPLAPTNPYGRTKFFIEEILRDLFRAEDSWQILILRYFNPVGAHESGLIGEDPRDIPNNLMPFIAQTAVGRREKLNIWGNDYETIDGTGVRDYIHVVDLAKAHVKALECLNISQCKALNIGTGSGYSVLELVKAFELQSQKKIPTVFSSRRKGDVARCFADVMQAKKCLNWQAEKSLMDMCADAWRWQSQNPEGYLPARRSKI